VSKATVSKATVSKATVSKPPDTASPPWPLAVGRLPDCGMIAVWPEPGTGWIHPEDVTSAERLLPSHRVWRRVRFDGEYYELWYGATRLRVRPCLWQTVPDTDIQLADRVEILSGLGTIEPGIARVREIRFDPARDEHAFFLLKAELPLPQPFRREQFQLLAVRHALKPPYLPHPVPKLWTSPDLELLDVGNLLSD
jgi:hypothetical protein